jgi:transcriptional regulator with XRE-family HTH domain
MTDTSSDLNQRLALRIRDLRLGLRLSLEGLADRSGVSRSMISLIERGESSATAVVLEKLAAALGLSLSSLFDTPRSADAAPADPVARLADQPAWKDPASGYVRRNVSPPWVPQPMQIVEVRFPSGQRVAFETGTRDIRVHQQIWMLDGTMDITTGDERHRLNTGDCLAMALDRHTVFHNPTRKAARYAVVIASEAGPRR